MKDWDTRAQDYLTWKEGWSLPFIKRNVVYAPILRHMLRRKIGQIAPKTLLEIGCGPGRLFSIYQGIETTCVDYSDEMLKRARAVKEERRYDNITLGRMDACSLYFPGTFDLALTSNVLLHISHEDIQAAVKSICTHARNVVIVEWVQPGASDVDGCYLHDYVNLFACHGFWLVDSQEVPFEHQMLYHFRKGETL